MALVHRDGSISLQSLVDLDNIHEIASLSLCSRNDYVHTVSLVIDHEGRPLLALCMHGSPRRYLHVHDFRYPTDQPQALLYDS